MRRAPVQAPAPRGLMKQCRDYLYASYIFFLFIKSRQLVDGTLFKIEIQLIKNEIQFKESLCAFSLNSLKVLVQRTVTTLFFPPIFYANTKNKTI